ncbi:MAG: hypothetical protein AAF566_05160 [Pseudomonadota bacterium]
MVWPLDPHARPVLMFRWAVFLLAGFFALRQLVFTADYSDAGGPFRFLTIWGLLLTFFCASRMLALSERRSSLTWPRLVMLTAVVNGLVVFLYWRLWFQDPALVNAREPLPLWVSLYVHGLGAALQWVDALVIYGAFRRPLQVIAPLFILVGTYVAWIEFFVAPMNEFPVGRVTEGLPYPFLNHMELPERLVFYAQTAAMGLAFLAVLSIAAYGVRRWRQSSAANSADNPER